MFVDFNKVFNKPETQISIPPKVIEYFNKSLPEGIRYEVDSSGNFVINSEDGKYTIGGFTFKPNVEQKKILGSNFTKKDVLDYCYNSQKPIQLFLNRDGYVVLNGKEIAIEKLSFNWLTHTKYKSGSFFVYPSKLPTPFELRIGNDSYTRLLKISRIANESVSVALYESDKNEPLFIRMLYDERKSSMVLNISFNLKNAINIQDIVESTSIYNSFLDGRGILFGERMDTNEKNEEATRFDDDSIVFWEKVLEIERALNVKFTPPKENVDFDTMCLVEQLYQNLIKKMPVRDNNTIDSINGVAKKMNDKVDIKSLINQEIHFEFVTTIALELFGVEKEICALVNIFNSIVSDFIIEGEKQRVLISDAGDDKKRYTSIMCFLTEDELNDFRKTDSNNRIQMFREAKYPQNYFNK